jgi:hypothetical protein
MAQFVYATSVVQSEYELKLPRRFQQTIIDKLWETLQREVFSTELPLPDQSIHAAETEVLLSGIKLDFQTKLQKPQVPTQGPHLDLESRDMTARLRIQAISVDQYIVREVGGVVGRFHLVARCENLSLQSKPGQAQFKMRLEPVLNGPRVSSHLEDMEISWSKDAWVLAPMTCTGAQGFEDVVTAHVLELTRNSEVLAEHKAELMTYVQTYLNTKTVDFSKPRILSSGRPDIQYFMEITDLKSDAQNLSARGLLTVHFKNIKSGMVSLALDKATSSPAPAGAVQLRVPEKLLETLIEKAFVPGTWSERIAAAQVPGFSALISSQLATCLLWPELRKFNPQAPFVFEVGTEVPVVMNGTDLNYQVEGVLGVQMYAPKIQNEKTALVPFMNFSIPLQSDIQVRLQQGRLSAAFTHVAMEIHPLWNPSYVSAYHPNLKFGVAALQKRLVKAAEGLRLEYALPRFQLMGGVALQLQNVSVASGRDLIFNLY